MTKDGLAGKEGEPISEQPAQNIMDPSRLSSSSSQRQSSGGQPNNPYDAHESSLEPQQQQQPKNQYRGSAATSHLDFKNVALRHQSYASQRSQQSRLMTPPHHQQNTHPPSFASSTAMPTPMFGDFVLHRNDNFGAAGEEDEDHALDVEKEEAAENPVTEPEPELPPPVKQHHRQNMVFYALRYLSIVVVVTGLLMVPVFVKRNEAEIDLTDSDAVKRLKKDQAVFWTFVWLVASWLGFVLFDLIGLMLPYLFRFVARYVNPAHQKYWRFLRVVRRPICLFFGIALMFSAYAGLITYNEDLGINVNKKDDSGDFLETGWTFVVNNVLEQVTIWAGFYAVGKILILYISIHYHYRGNNTKILRSKEMMNALITLYDASLAVHPARPNDHNNPFAAEDAIVQSATGREYSSGRKTARSYLARMGIDTYGLATFFGNFLSDDPRSHWLRPASSYATIERCLANPRTAAALARRIWVSLAVQGSDVLASEDVVEVLGFYRREEAARAFKTVGPMADNVRLDEFAMAVVEAGKIRHDVYRAMCAADHVLNVLDWMIVGGIAAVMTLFIMLLYVPSIKEIQQQASVFAVGLSFAAGRVVHHFLIGVVFVFFDHPFDEGDRVEVYNLSSTNKTACVVKRISLLYTVFRRVDNGADMQIQNQQLVMKRIENISRSGNNRQILQLCVDFKTSFTDIVFLRRELEAFVRADENCRDYMPEVGCSLIGVHELNKLELKCSVTHRSNWGNEKLRSARSNKFYCAVLAAVRKIPLNRPGGPLYMGEAGRPVYTAQLDEEQANRLVQSGHEALASARADFHPEAARDDDEAGQRDAEGADTESVLRDRERRDKAKAERATAAEAERVALATLQRVPTPEKDKVLGVSSAVQVNDYIGRSATGMRIKPGSAGYY
ncbi:hypothetical protein PpBr36_02569 [Pyricularia pennisetigena]|uniref:hypothetical protein n=1 Tax=Pyricularia pennisetigena TaxID=1578925 RepID=UPI0011502C2C|nr:hypothetical protein PpBr36_02569 [Pyricularia pennisetigena]TLS31338.1 hypothetical protein PpBr36_02569 [Pyricularia pennisetigena]